MAQTNPTSADLPCPTCNVEPGRRCVDRDGSEFGFGGAHVSRVREALTARKAAPREETE